MVVAEDENVNMVFTYVKLWKLKIFKRLVCFGGYKRRGNMVTSRDGIFSKSRGMELISDSGLIV